MAGGTTETAAQAAFEMGDLWIPLLSGVLALIGAWLGAFFNRTNEHRQWLRNERLKAYNDYLELIGLTQLRHFMLLTDGSSGEAMRLLEKFHDCSIKVAVVAPSEIAQEVINSLDDMAGVYSWAGNLPEELAKKHLRSDMPPEEREAAVERIGKEAYAMLSDRLETFFLGSLDRLNKIANLIREDLKVSEIRRGLFHGFRRD